MAPNPASVKYLCVIQYKRVVKGIFVSRHWLISVRVKCETLDFGAVKCDLFYTIVLLEK